MLIMWIVLDLIVAFICVFFLISGAKKGFIKSCLGLVVTLVSIVITINFHGVVANFYRDTIVYDSLKDNLKTAVQNHIGDSENPDTMSQFFRDVSGNLPEFGKMMASLNVDPNDVADGIEMSVNSGEQVTVDMICEGIVEEAAVFISDGAAIISLFLASMLVLTLVVYILDLIFKLPVLNFANKLLGVLIGAVKALLVSFVIISAIKVAVPYLDGSGIKIDGSDMEKTVLFSAIDSINPLSFQ